MKNIHKALAAIATASILVGTVVHQVGSKPANAALLYTENQSITSFSQYEPNPNLTPGKSDPSLTVQVLTAPGFTTSKYRNVPESEKKQVFHEYGFVEGHYTPGNYEIDHIISLELGGSNDIQNLWPEPYTGLWNAHIKDRLENKLNSMVHKNQISLQEAQFDISHDWVSTYLKYVNPASNGTN